MRLQLVASRWIIVCARIRLALSFYHYYDIGEHMNKPEYLTKDFKVETYMRVPLCGKCKKELRSLGQGMSNSAGSWWMYHCDGCDIRYDVSSSDEGVIRKRVEEGK